MLTRFGTVSGRVDDEDVNMEEVYRERVKLWTTALRSGEYRQAKGRLKKYFLEDEGGGIGYCCLGVACEVMLQNADLSAAERVALRDTIENDYLLSISAARWFGVGYQTSPYVRDETGNWEALTGLNDGGNHTFADIANLIDNGVFMQDA